MNTHFLCLFFEWGRHLLFLCRDVLHSNALPCFCNIMLCQRRFRNVNIAHETVMNHNFLRSVFTYTLCFIHFDSVNQFTQKRGSQLVPRLNLFVCLDGLMFRLSYDKQTPFQKEEYAPGADCCLLPQ